MKGADRLLREGGISRALENELEVLERMEERGEYEQRLNRNITWTLWSKSSRVPCSLRNDGRDKGQNKGQS